MAQFIPEEDESPPILIDQAVAVDSLHKALPRHGAMIIIAEYPQQHERFAGLESAKRAERARDWISRITGITPSISSAWAHSNTSCNVKFGKEVIELMAACPGRDFRMIELVRHATGGAN